MDECRKRLRKVGRKGVDGSSSDFYFASLDGNLVLDGGKDPSRGSAPKPFQRPLSIAPLLISSESAAMLHG